MELKTSVLYYGDNLDILRHHIPEESIDLVYLDPPFNSKATYNVLFREASGAGSDAQIEAFEDTWHWGPSAERTYEEVVTSGRPEVGRMLKAMVEGLRRNDVTAYLSMMGVRLVELHRVLKPTGSIYLHCDPTASHYLKLLMDAVFGPHNFKNEISWKRTTTKGDYRQGATNWPRVRDVLLHYCKDVGRYGIFNQPFTSYVEDYLTSKYPYIDEEGRRYGLWDLTAPGSGSRGHPQYEFLGVTRYWRYSSDKMQALLAAGRIIQPRPGAVPRYKRFLDEMPGVAIGDSWDDIPPINSQAKERLGYPTQKPLTLLERIINASSNPDDIILDPFCGCGTALHAAHKLGRRWIGIDITWLAIALVRRRMEDAFPGIQVEEVGSPVDMTGAHALASAKPKQFEYWVIDQLDALPTGGKGPYLDGVKPFIEFGGKAKAAIISVKGTKTATPEMVREVQGVLNNDNPIGVLVTLAEPTKGMETQAASAGFYESSDRKYARMQVISVAAMLKGARIDLPSHASPYAKAPSEPQTEGTQANLDLPPA